MPCNVHYNCFRSKLFFPHNFHLCGNQNRCVRMIFCFICIVYSREARVKRPNHAMRVKLYEFKTRACNAFCVTRLLFLIKKIKKIAQLALLVGLGRQRVQTNIQRSAVQSGPLRYALLDLAVCLVAC